MFLEKLLKSKTASVWGLGYLGYTTILQLQGSGFAILAHDLDTAQAKQLTGGKYPTREQVNAWSKIEYNPPLRMERITLTKNPKDMFANSALHFIAIPERYKNASGHTVTEDLAEIFSRNLKKQKSPPLILFESAFIPGHIERYFVRCLKERKIICGRHYYLGTLFRADWNVESFITRRNKIVVSGYCQESLERIRKLLSYLGIEAIELSGIKEAEIYINALNTIQSMVNDFMRQLAMGYPLVNMSRISELLFKNISLEDCILNMGTGGTKITFAIEHLLKGSDKPEYMTLLNELREINISSVLSYAEYLIRHAYKSVAIIGITYSGNQKDLTLSPAITLADYLVRNSTRVLIHDPFYSRAEIKKLIKDSVVVDFPREVFSAEAIVVAADHNLYKYLSQEQLDNISGKTKLIIDNYGIWSHLNFGDKTKYHKVGDGKLNISE